jgi:hypothetical protein
MTEKHEGAPWPGPGDLFSPEDSEQTVARLIATIVDAKAKASAAAAPWEDIQSEARAHISQIMADTGQTDWKTATGRAYVPAAGVSVSYDAKALDALCASSPEIAAILSPHRRETMRVGSLTVKGA